MLRKTGLLLFILLFCGLSGCSLAASAPEQGEHRISDISSLETETLSMAGNIQQSETLIGDRFTLTGEESGRMSAVVG